MATFCNRATLVYSGGVVNSNVVTGEIVRVITAVKTAVVDEYTPGGVNTYVLSLTNNGTADVTGLTVSDDLGAYCEEDNTPRVRRPQDYVNGSVKYYVNGVLQAAPSVSVGAALTISGIRVPAGGNALILYSARTNEYAPRGRNAEIVNTATVSGSALPEPIEAEETIRFDRNCDLRICKDLSPARVTENSRLTYTFVIQNFGTEAVTAADNVVVRDTFDPVLGELAVTLNGSALSPNSGYTYNGQSGAFATRAGRITVPAATYERDCTSGVWSVNPGSATLIVQGTV